MKKAISSLSLWLVVFSCTCEMPTEPKQNEYLAMRWDYYLVSGEFQGHGIYEYETPNSRRLIKTTFYSSNDSANLNRATTYEYDSTGNLAREMSYYSNNGFLFSSSTAYLYDSANNLIKQEFYNSDSQITSYNSNYQYDAANNLIRFDRYSYNDQLTTYHIDEYDDNNNWIKRDGYRADGSLFSSRIFEYNSANRIIGEKNPGATNFDITYQYDENNLIIRMTDLTVSPDSSDYYRVYQYERY